MSVMLDALARALQEGIGGYQRFQTQIRPALQEQDVSRARNSLQFMTTLAGNDPQRAFQMFGDRYLSLAKSVYGVEIPTEEEPIFEEGTEEQQITRAVPIPGEQFPPETRFLPGRGTQPGILGLPTREEVTTQIVPFRRQTGAQRRLAIPTTKEPTITVPGLGKVPLSAAKDLLGQEGVRNLLQIADPVTLGRLQLDINRLELEQARLAWQQYQHVNPSAYQEAQTALRELELQSLNAYRNVQIALATGNQEEAKRWHDMQYEIQKEANAIRRAAEGEGGADRVGIRQAESAVAAAEAKLQNLLGMLRNARARGLVEPDELVVGTTTMADLENQVAGARFELQSRQATLQRMRGTAGGAAPAERTYQTRSSGTLTSSQVQQIIRNMIAQGISRAQIKQALLDNGIPPENFGL